MKALEVRVFTNKFLYNIEDARACNKNDVGNSFPTTQSTLIPLFDACNQTKM